MKTPQQYIDSLAAMKHNVWMNGQQVERPWEHPQKTANVLIGGSAAGRGAIFAANARSALRQAGQRRAGPSDAGPPSHDEANREGAREGPQGPDRRRSRSGQDRSRRAEARSGRRFREPGVRNRRGPGSQLILE